MGLSNDFQGLLKRVKLPQKSCRHPDIFAPYLILMTNSGSIFMRALEYAGVALMMIAVLLPNMIVWKLMKEKIFKAQY